MIMAALSDGLTRMILRFMVTVVTVMITGDSDDPTLMTQAIIAVGSSAA